MQATKKLPGSEGQVSRGVPPVGASATPAARRRARGLRWAPVVAVLALAAALPVGGLLPARVAAAADAAYRVVDPSAVYLGNPRLFKKPAVLDCDRVYRAIPEYQEILDKNLTDKDVRYHFLMRKASDKFSAAVRGVASDGGYDLVAGLRAVVPANRDTPEPTDVTDATIKKLPA